MHLLWLAQVAHPVRQLASTSTEKPMTCSYV